MADLTPFVFQGQFPRSRVGRAGAGGAGQLPAQAPGGVQAGAAALGGFGDALGKVGQVVSQIDTRFARIQARNQGAAATVEMLDAMEVEAQRILDDTTIQPMNRAASFAEVFDQTVEKRSAALPAEVRAGFLTEVATARRNTMRALTNSGREETYRRSLVTFDDLVERSKTSLQNAITPIQEQEILTLLRGHGQQLVDEKVLPQEDLDARLQDVERDAVASRFTLFVQQKPQEALEVLANPEHPDVQRLPPDKRAALIDLAEKEELDGYRKADYFQTQRSEAKKSRSAESRAGMMEQMVADAESPLKLEALLQTAKDRRLEGILIPEDAEAIQRYGRTLLSQGATEARTQTDPEILKKYFALLLTDPTRAIGFVQDHTGDGLAVGAASGFFASARAAEDENHYRNLPEVKDALSAIEGQLSSTGDPFLDEMKSFDISAIREDAELEFMVRIAGIAGRDGLDKAAVLQVTPAVRDAVIASHRTRLKNILSSGRGNAVGDPQTLNVKDAVRQWQFMIERGVPKHEADAFLGRELARHTATVAPEDLLMNNALIAEELREALQEPVIPRALPPPGE